MWNVSFTVTSARANAPSASPIECEKPTPTLVPHSGWTSGPPGSPARTMSTTGGSGSPTPSITAPPPSPAPRLPAPTTPAPGARHVPLSPRPHPRSRRRLPMPKRSIALVALVPAALVASAVPGESQAPAKIGVIQPLSGPVAASGNYVRMGAEIARDWVNGKGGVLGRKVELLIEDNKSDPKEAATAAEKLIIRDKVPIIVGAWGSSMTLAAMPNLEDYGEIGRASCRERV